MKSRIFALALAAVFAFSFNSCKKEEMVQINGILKGVFYDGATKQPLAGVVINVVGSKDTVMTRTDGSFTLSGLKSGDQTVIAKKTGYLRVSTVIYFEISGASSTKSKTYDVVQILDNYNTVLYPLTGKAKGVVKNVDGTLSSGASVKISSDDSTFTTTTDANGAFSFDALPFSPGDYMSAYASNGDASSSDGEYYGSTTAQTLGFEIRLSQGSFKFLYANYQKVYGNQNFSISSDIELVFSDNVDLAITLKYGSLKLYKSGYGEVGADYTASGNKITINPKNDLEEGSTYYVSGEVYASEYNSTYVSSQYFYTAPTTANVVLNPTSAATVTATSSTLSIIAPAGTSYVKIYKTLGTPAEFYYNDYVYVSSGVASYDISGDAVGTKYYVIAVGDDANGNTVYSAQSNIAQKLSK